MGAFGVQLRWELIETRIAAAGGVHAVERSTGMNRSTLWRWKHDGVLPSEPLRFLRLAQALDLDPLLLFELDAVPFERLCFEVGKRLLAGGMRRALGSLSFVQDFWAHSTDPWPVDTIGTAPDCVEFEWTRFPFVHRGQLPVGPGGSGRNGYAAFLPSSPRIERRSAGPQVWHFAYRDRLGWKSLWRPYGVVALVGDRLELYAYHGVKQVERAPGPIAVQTWLGEGDAEFRIASLHPFEADVRAAVPPGTSTVCFSVSGREAPG